MKKHNQRFTAILLVLILTFSLMTSCNNTQTEPDDTDIVSDMSSDTETSPPETDEYGRIVPEYPLENGMDFDGYDICMISRDQENWYIDFGVDELNGELVNDAVYNRNLQVASDINVNFTRKLVDSNNAATSETVGDTIRMAYMAADTSYDLAGFYQLYGGSVLATSGALMNIYEVPHIKLDNPWWNSDFTNELTYNGQLYYAIGDMNLSVTSMLMGIFFNHQKFIDYYEDVSVLYDTVREGKWTKDVFQQYVEGTYQDYDGNGTKTADDFLGFILDEANIGPWPSAFGIRFCTKDDTGKPQLSLFNEKFVNAYYWMYDFFLESNDVYFAPKDSGYLDVFKSDRALFSVITFADAVSSLRDMESSYGVLPMPKYDESQEKYYNAAHEVSNLMGVVQNTLNPAAVGAALELLNYYSYLTVNPVYFETALKSKYFRDSDSVEMFDLIRAGAVVDFGQVYSLGIGGGSYSFDTTYHLLCRNQIRIKNRDITSRYRKNEEAYQYALDEILKQYDDMAAAK